MPLNDNYSATPHNGGNLRKGVAPLEEFFDYKNFSSGFFREVEECIEVNTSMKILFVDIDGTLTETISEYAFKQSPNDVKIIEGADKAVAHFAKLGWHIIGVSNQGGVASGFKTIADTIEEMANTLRLFPGLSRIYFCPDFEGKELYFVSRDDCDRVILLIDFISCRKPSPGMIKNVLLGKDVTEVWMVGDRPEDEQCAANAGVNFCPADMWRDRFRPGMFTYKVTPAQLEFLEGIST